MKFLVVGGSAGLGRALAEEIAKRRHDLVLVGSDARDLAALCAHLKLTYAVRADYLKCRIGCGEATSDRCILESVKQFPDIEAVLLPIGVASDEDTGLLDSNRARYIMDVNFLSQAALISALWPRLATRQRAYVVGFGSVAALRGRRRNIIYAAAKRALLSYFESLRHLATGTGVKVHFYQLGYLDTQQTFGKRLLFPKVDPKKVARFVLDRLDKNEPTLIYPRFWRVIGLVLRSLPWSIYKRLQF